MPMKTYPFFPFLFCVLVFCSPVIANAQSSTANLTLSTDKQTYYGFTAVTINGLLQYNGPSSNVGLVGLQVQDSKGNTLVIRTIKIGASIPSFLPIQINSAYLSDMSGSSPVSSIQAGALGYFAINFVNNDNLGRNMLVTLNLYDASGIPIGQISGTASRRAGESGTVVFSIQIPPWATSGTACGYASVYTDWPSNGGVAISPEQQFQFSVKDGSSGVANISSSNGNQGSYSLTFRLPAMGPVNALYHVFVSSSNLDGNILKSVSFSCHFGDYTNDGTVDYQDLFLFADSFIYYNAGNPNYSHLCDMDQDGKINAQDFFMFVNTYIIYWSVYQQ